LDSLWIIVKYFYIPMRITILTSSYPRFPGDGTAPFIQSIAEHLVKIGHDVEVVAPYDAEVQEDESAKVKVHRFRYIWPLRWHIMGHARSLQADVRLRPLVYFLLPLFLFEAFIRLMQVTRAQKSQMIHVNWVLPNGSVAALVSALTGIPFVVSLHGSDVYVARSNPIYRSVAGWVFRRASAVTACSKELLQKAGELGAPQDTHMLTWGADPGIFQPRPNSPDLARSLGLSADEINIIALGRFVYKKGFDFLLRAFAALALHYPNARLLIGGDGPLRASLEELARTHGIQNQVAFPGRIPWDQVADFLSLGDIFVLPSIQDEHGNLDGLPTVLLEAMACGLPVIASQIGGVPLVIQDGVNGLHVPPGDGQSLSKAIERLLQYPDEREKLGQAARGSVVSEHNWDAVANKLTKIFNDAAQ